MPNDIKFNKQQVPNCDVYSIKLNSTPYLTKVDGNESLTFTRIGQDHEQGFTISITGPNAPDDIVVDTGSDSTDISVPDTSQETEWKYTISFHKEAEIGDTVVDLDPIIIINPGKSSFLLRALVAFTFGVAATLGATKLFPGLLG